MTVHARGAKAAVQEMPGSTPQGMVKEGYTFGLPLLVLGGVFLSTPMECRCCRSGFLALFVFLSFAIRSA